MRLKQQGNGFRWEWEALVWYIQEDVLGDEQERSRDKFIGGTEKDEPAEGYDGVVVVLP